MPFYLFNHWQCYQQVAQFIVNTLLLAYFLILTLYPNSWDLENSQVHVSRVPNFIGH